MSVLIEGISWAFVLAGAFFSIVGAFGLLRMPDCYTRMHAASVTDTLGAGFLLGGMILQAGLSLVAVKLLVIAVLIFFTSPAATHALAKAAMARKVAPLLTEEGGSWKR
jgi:multicomponent Na+:H+ antiporter subunit G